MNETVHCTLMQLYAWTGQRSAALHQYQDCVDILKEQLGIAPQKTTTDLFQSIQNSRTLRPLTAPDEQSSILTDSREQVPGAQQPQKVELTESLFSNAVIGQPTDNLPTDHYEPLSNLPLQLTSFIGREQEIAAIRRMLEAAPARLVTLTGPGGTGKTRLVLRLGEELLTPPTPSLQEHQWGGQEASSTPSLPPSQDNSSPPLLSSERNSSPPLTPLQWGGKGGYPQGVWLVKLAPLNDPGLVPQAVASVLGVREIPGRHLTDVLCDFLRHKRLLLILDNCEHLVAACAALAQALLQSSLGLHVLATSRERLGIEGEMVFTVPPLKTPPGIEIANLPALAQYEAVALFIERAQAALPVFTLTEQNAATVAAVCQRLEGIPLAIELAAARLRLLSLDQVLARLDDAFRLLAGGNRTAPSRHQALRALIDWSYNLLNAKERQLLTELSAFSGSWTLEGAEAVSAGEDILNLLGSLVDKSLVQVSNEQGKEPRFRVLETIRQYALEKLTERGAVAQARRRHLAYYLGLAERIEPELNGTTQVERLDQLEIELDNIRTALGWALIEDKPSGQRLAAALYRLWFTRGHHHEGVEWLEKLLEVGVYERSGQALRVYLQDTWRAVSWAQASNALVDLSLLYPGSLSLLQKRELIDQCIAVCRDLGVAARHELGRALMVKAGFTFMPNFEQRQQLLLESLAIWKCIGDTFLTSACLFNLSFNAQLQGKHHEWADYLQESLALSRQIGDLGGIAVRMIYMGKVLRLQGEYQRGVAAAEEAITYYLTNGDKSRNQVPPKLAYQ